MKNTNLIYWIVTIIFGGFMMFSAIPDIILVPEAIEFVVNQLGYPEYFLPFIGVAKALGVIALFIPGFPRITEWAYAGLFFDLIGAVYSNIVVMGFKPDMFVMLLPLSFLFYSRHLYYKRIELKKLS